MSFSSFLEIKVAAIGNTQLAAPVVAVELAAVDGHGGIDHPTHELLSRMVLNIERHREVIDTAHPWQQGSSPSLAVRTHQAVRPVLMQPTAHGSVIVRIVNIALLQHCSYCEHDRFFSARGKGTARGCTFAAINLR